MNFIPQPSNTFDHPALYSWTDCDGFDVATVNHLYENYIGRTQAKTMSLLGMGRTTVRYAQGNLVHTNDGRQFLDFTGGIGVLGLGHNHPRILAARAQFAKNKSMEVHKAFLSKYMAGLSHNIAALLPGDLNFSFMCNSGSEAVEGALKLAYKYHSGRRKHVLHAHNSFHGKLLGSGGLTARTENNFPFPTIPGIETFEYGSIDSLEEKISNLRTANGRCDIYAIIVEPYCVNQLQACSEAFLRQLQKMCRRENIILIFDEVYTGWGKTGSLFYFMRYEGLLPDIVTMSKTLGGGKASISCYTARTPIHQAAYDNRKDFMLHTTTYNGFGEECITAIEAIAIINDEQLVQRAHQIHARLNQGLETLKIKHPSLLQDARGCGTIQGIILNADLPGSVQKALNFLPLDSTNGQMLWKQVLTLSVLSELFETHNIITYSVPNDVVPLMLAPSMITTDEQIDLCLEALDATLSLGKTGLITNLIHRNLLQKICPSSSLELQHPLVNQPKPRNS